MKLLNIYRVLPKDNFYIRFINTIKISKLQQLIMFVLELRYRLAPQSYTFG